MLARPCRHDCGLHHLGGYGEPALISGLHLPNGIAVSGSNRFVANNGEAGPVGGTGTIGEYTTSGATVNPTLVSGLSFPSGIAVVPTVPEPIAASHLHSSDSFLRNSIRMTQNAPKKLLDYRVGTRPRRADHRKAWPLSRRPLAQGLTMIRGRIVGISDEWYEFRNGIPRSSDN